MKENGLPLVSIVTPCLNAQRYIEQCISSARAQEYPRVEHVIVDGKSEDGTLAIIRKHERKYDVRWISEHDANASEATNKGMRMARGSILAILPSDDIYFPWTVQTVVAKFGNNPDVDIVYGDLLQLPFGSAYGTIYFNPPEEELARHLVYNSIGGMAVFFRREVYDALNGFDESLRITSDYDFWLRARKRFKFSKVDEVLACFRFRNESVSMRDSDSHRQERSKLRTNHRGGGASEPSVRLLEYYSRRSVYVTRTLTRLLFEETHTGESKHPWSNLLNRHSISRLRLLRELIFAPFFTTNLLQRNIRHGYVDTRKILENLTRVTE